MSDVKDKSPKKADEKPAKADETKKETVQPQSTPVEKPPVPAEDDEDVIDMETFQQIMDMDEDDGDEDDEEKNSFSKGIVWGYFDQAEATFIEMQEAIGKKDLPQLSSLGHFLKGSSAALGIIKVQASCEKMQHYGNRRDEEAGVDLNADEALERIKGLLTSCKKDYEVAKAWMKKLYEE